MRLHVARIDNWTGAPAGQEGQEVQWRAQNTLDEVELLPATNVILAALNLPPLYIVTPPIGRGRNARQSWFEALDRALRTHAGESAKAFLRLRQPQLDDDDYAELAKRVIEHARRQRARVLLDRSVSLVERLGAAGLHCSTRRAARMDKRPIGQGYWFGVSTHDADELAHAADIGADFATLSPVAATETHPETAPMGWPGFEEARGEAALPVYALGGMRPDDLATARDHYAQGVAGIRGFWPGS